MDYLSKKEVTMRLPFLLLPLLLSTVLYAQKTLQEARVEENLFILKIIGIVAVGLVAMPLLLRKLRKNVPEPARKHTAAVHRRSVATYREEEPRDMPAAEEEAEDAADPLESVLEDLFDKHGLSAQQRMDWEPLYRRYIELKMGKVEIKTASFNFNTMLDSVVEKADELASKRNFEIVFDIEGNVPVTLIGDGAKVADMLFFVLRKVILGSSDYITVLKIKRLNLGDGAVHMEFYLPYAKDNYMAEYLDVFTPFEGDDRQGALSLYLAREYARLMQGDITFELCDTNDSAFAIDIKLYMPDPTEMRHYRLPSKKMMGHNVLLLDDHKESAIAVQKMFEHFKNKTDLYSPKELFADLKVVENYDIVVIQERYFSKNLVEKLQQIKAVWEIKVISLNKNEVFEHKASETKALLDGQVCKPVTLKKVYELLIAQYQEQS